MLKKLTTVLLVVFSLSGCISMTTEESIVAKPEITQTLTRFTREYVLVPGDMLEITVYRNPEVSRNVIVRGDGFISLPLLDQIKVSGMTMVELDDYLTERLSKRLVDPELTVILSNPPQPMVYIYGEVAVTKAIPLRDARTAAQAVAYAGDMLKSGKMNYVSVIRLNEEGYLTAMTIENETSGQPGFYMALQNMPLQADDLVIVPESMRYQLIRQLNDSVGAINQILTPYFQYSLLKQFD